MTQPSFQDLVRLPEDRAFEWLSNARNLLRLYWFLGLVALVAFGVLVYRLFEAKWLGVLAPIGLLTLARISSTVAEARVQERAFRWVLVASLVAAFVLCALLLPELRHSCTVVGILGSLSLLAFRLRTLDTALLLAALLGIAAVPMFQGQEVIEAVAVQAILAVTVLALVRPAHQTAKREFLDRFQIERSRDREQHRMRKELDSARQIQLSMLPRRDPQFPGLDISAASLPAAEVGGDYYEYFPIDDKRLAIVLADVAGHGVASGLLLSGVRSCLHLLKGRPRHPVEIVTRLDRMVRDTTEKRMFITLLYAQFDLEDQSLVLASAGHPPPVIVRDGVPTLPPLQSPPLGTQLPHDFVEHRFDLRPGDRYVLYTDGLTEMCNDNGDMYGEERLATRVARVDAEKDARAVREAVLTDVWTYKGNDEQLDDVTIVSVKVDGEAQVDPLSAADTAS